MCKQTGQQALVIIQPEVVVEEQSKSASTSRLWKLRWHPQAAHISAAAVPSAPDAMNSRHPSTAYPPMAAAWLRWHSR
jgi:hypothetical protein